MTIPADQAGYEYVNFYIELSINSSLLDKCNNSWTYPSKINMSLPQFQPVVMKPYEEFTGGSTHIYSPHTVLIVTLLYMVYVACRLYN